MRTPNQLGRPGPLKPVSPSGALVRMKKVSQVVAFALAGSLLITPTRSSKKTAPQQAADTPAVAIKKEVAELPKLKEVKAIRGEAVETFMIRAFGIKGGQEFYASESWNLLVDTFTGHRVRRPNRDLIANHGYIFAKDETEASKYSAYYKNLAKERRAQAPKVTKSQRTVQTQAKKQKTTTPMAPKMEKKKTPEKKPEVKALKPQEKKKPEIKIMKKDPIKKPKPLEKLPAIPTIDARQLPKIQAPKVVSEVPKTESKPVKKSVETPLPTVSKKVPSRPTGGKILTPESTQSKYSAPVFVPAPEVIEQLRNWQITLDAYYHGSGSMESGGNFATINNIGARGKWQFMPDTLKALGLSDHQIKIFPKKPALQKYAMDKFTYGNIQYIMREPVLRDMIGAELHPVELLAAMHHMGPDGVKKVAQKATNYSNQVTAFKKSLKNIDDGNVSTYIYTQIVKNNYLSTLNAGFEETKKSRVASASAPVAPKRSEAIPKKNQAITPAAPTKAKLIQESSPKVMEVERVEAPAPVGSVASELVETQGKTKGTPHASNILPFIPSAQVNAILENVQQTEMRDEVREGLIAKLAGVNDVVALYQENIEHYEFEAHIGSLEAREILPGLRDLLSTAKKEQTDLRATIEESIMHYELELHRGSKYAAEILPKLYAIAGDDDRSIVAELAA